MGQEDTRVVQQLSTDQPCHWMTCIQWKKKLSSCTIASWEEKSLHHIAIIAKFIDLNKPRPPKYGSKKQANKPKIVMFKVWLSFTWWLLFFHHLTIQVAEIQKFCVHVNATSHLYSLFHDTGIVILQIQQQIALLVEVNNVQCFWIISKNFNHQINQRCLMRNIKWMNDAACQKDRPIGC